MKANELMIGDWVTVRRPSNRREKVRVKSVIGNGTIEAKTKDGLVVFGELAVEPIPLTVEILEKNGFERSKVFVEWKYEDDDVYMIYKPFPYLKIQMEECNIAFPCEYVHELQHALRLCGIEIEIKL